MDKILSRRSAARLLSVSERSLDRYCERGIIPSFSLGYKAGKKRIFFSEVKLLSWMQAKENPGELEEQSFQRRVKESDEVIFLGENIREARELSAGLQKFVEKETADLSDDEIEEREKVFRRLSDLHTARQEFWRRKETEMREFFSDIPEGEVSRIFHLIIGEEANQ